MRLKERSSLQRHSEVKRESEGRSSRGCGVDFPEAAGTLEIMPVTVETMAEEALGLSVSGRVLLVEKLLSSLAGEVNTEVERVHLNEIRERRAAVTVGQMKLVDGAEGLKQARAAVQK
jgi:hypothetical protein